jgi:hypothetical protein
MWAMAIADGWGGYVVVVLFGILCVMAFAAGMRDAGNVSRRFKRQRRSLRGEINRGRGHGRGYW